jgi:4-hydroxybenzoate polyprenyltransferase
MPDVGLYLLERTFTIHVGMLVSLLFSLTFLVAPTASLFDISERVAIICGLTLALRLWDDLADVEQDRQMHPDRVLCRSKNRLAFAWTLFATLCATNIFLLVVRSPWYAAVLICTLALLCLIYLSNLPRLLSSALVLCKYSVIIAFAVPTSGISRTPGRLILAMIAGWLCVGAYDMMEHYLRRQAPQRPGA